MYAKRRCCMLHVGCWRSGGYRRPRKEKGTLALEISSVLESRVSSSGDGVTADRGAKACGSGQAVETMSHDICRLVIMERQYVCCCQCQGPRVWLLLRMALDGDDLLQMLECWGVGAWQEHCALPGKVNTPEGGVYFVLYVFVLYFVLYLYFWAPAPRDHCGGRERDGASCLEIETVLAVHLALGYAQCLTLSSIM
jgi:hypothetical protein